MLPSGVAATELHSHPSCRGCSHSICFDSLSMMTILFQPEPPNSSFSVLFCPEVLEIRKRMKYKNIDIFFIMHVC